MTSVTGPPDAVVAHGRQAGDRAALARVQQRGHFLLDDGRRAGRGDVNAGQQTSPRAAEAKTMMQSMPGHADGMCLLSGEHVELMFEGAEELVLVRPGRGSHAGIMPTGSDKTDRKRGTPKSHQFV
jgi:hypothetical protein